ncbi:GA-binding protein subunit beta-1-like [Branchiostoma lanceolatum]|uniref:GA-binding protein subunit beta-1-like n=1 Tax=Branchiostoma lanceolatum TaxID=7740 RepID=UPI003453C432
MAKYYYSANHILLYAAENGSLGGVKAALKAGADIDYDRPGSTDMLDTSGTDDSTFTPLIIACIKGHVDVVRLLLRKGASLVKRTVGATTALHAAAREGRTEVVEVLVQHGATLDVLDGYQLTPLMTACCHERVETVRRLLELGARPDLAAKGVIAQRVIDDRGSEESIKLLLEARKSKLLRCCNPTCGKPGYRKTLKLCGGCKLTRYCSRDCQKQHWSVGHKKCCGHDADTGEPDLGLFLEKLVFMMANHAH